MRPKRQGLIIWYRNRRNIRQIRRYGHLLYTSRKMKYAVLYVNKIEMKEIEDKIKKLPFVKKVERSLKPHIRTSFEKRDTAKVKEYDYHIGI